MTPASRLVVASCATLALAVASPAMSRDLLYSTFLSSEHHLTKNVVVPFTNDLREATGGELNFDVASGGALAGARETLKAMETGTIDAGFIIDIYTPSSLPHTALLSDLSLLIDNAIAATAAMNETVLIDCEECRASLEKHNVKPLGFVSTSVYALQCTTPVTSLDTIKGLKVRATGAWAPLIEEIGATPVNVPTSELFEGLQRGVLDCSVGPVAHLPSYSLYEVVTDVNAMPIGAYAGGLSLNVSASVWEDLTEEQRAAMLELTPKYVAAGIYGYIASDAEALAEAQKRGITLNPAAPDIVAAYDAYKTAVVEKTIAKGEADSAIADPAGFINAYVENLAKWSKITAEIGDDQAAFEQALKDEIYSKLK